MKIDDHRAATAFSIMGLYYAMEYVSVERLRNMRSTLSMGRLDRAVWYVRWVLQQQQRVHVTYDGEARGLSAAKCGLSPLRPSPAKSKARWNKD